MTLSEREQRTLDRIETDCRQDDPGFAVPLDLTALLQNPPTGLTPIRRTPGASQRRSGDDVRVLDRIEFGGQAVESARVSRPEERIWDRHDVGSPMNTNSTQ
jgi:hypothetical protein